jgi:hypothetical protein
MFMKELADSSTNILYDLPSRSEADTQHSRCFCYFLSLSSFSRKKISGRYAQKINELVC